MSHGAGGEGGVKADPNLTPLLDVVLQLIMFFMVGVSFVTNQVNENIELPLSQSARPMDKGDTDMLFLNLNDKGQLEVVGEKVPRKTEAEMKAYLQQQYDDLLRLAKGRHQDKVKTAIILRADKRADYGPFYQLLRLCKDVGFTKFHIRALTQT
jgi:biopolymer transport protein ExbD